MTAAPIRAHAFRHFGPDFDLFLFFHDFFHFFTVFCASSSCFLDWIPACSGFLFSGFAAFDGGFGWVLNLRIFLLI